MFLIITYPIGLFPISVASETLVSRKLQVPLGRSIGPYYQVQSSPLRMCRVCLGRPFGRFPSTSCESDLFTTGTLSKPHNSMLNSHILSSIGATPRRASLSTFQSKSERQTALHRRIFVSFDDSRCSDALLMGQNSKPNSATGRHHRCVDLRLTSVCF